MISEPAPAGALPAGGYFYHSRTPMRSNPTRKIENFRVRSGPLASTSEYGANGAFTIPYGPVILTVIVNDATTWQESGLPLPAWEHVSVSLPARCPTWKEMDFIKRIFWRDDELVLQFHVPRAQHVNLHENCLHLWKPVGVEIPLPPPSTVG